MNVFRKLFFGLLLCATLLPFGTPEALATEQNLAIPGKGTLIFDLPAGWTSTPLTSSPDQPPMMELAAANSDAFRLRFTVLWTKQPDTTYNTPDAIRSLMQKTGEGQLFTAVEQDVTLKQFQGSVGTGYWFALTDRAPATNGFKYMMHGGYPVGPLLLDFIELSTNPLRDGDSKALGVITSMKLIPETK